MATLASFESLMVVLISAALGSLELLLVCFPYGGGSSGFQVAFPKVTALTPQVPGPTQELRSCWVGIFQLFIPEPGTSPPDRLGGRGATGPHGKPT